MSSYKILLLFIFASSLSLARIQAKVHYHKWEITYQYKSPDCFNKLAITINGQTPGPTIYASQGDTIVVDVKNSLLTENTAIHWHGIRQVL
jgi:FtsP/CotA-like multicopper oxidase with cupredoxin domain